MFTILFKLTSPSSSSFPIFCQDLLLFPSDALWITAGKWKVQACSGRWTYLNAEKQSVLCCPLFPVSLWILSVSSFPSTASSLPVTEQRPGSGVARCWSASSERPRTLLWGSLSSRLSSGDLADVRPGKICPEPPNSLLRVLSTEGLPPYTACRSLGQIPFP